jgi:hypothetical protein
VRGTLVRLPAPLQDVAKSMLGVSLDTSKATHLSVTKNCAPRRLRFGQIATEVNHVALADAAQQDRLLITSRRCDPTGFRVCGSSPVKISLEPPHTT